MADFRFQISDLRFKNSNHIILYFSCLCLLLFTFTPFFSFAQERPFSVEKLSDVGTNQDFVVGPGKVEATLNPGDERTINLRVTNRTGKQKTFLIEIEDFRGSQDPTQTVILLGDERGPYSLKDYLQIPAYEFVLEHGERATIPVTVSIPFDEEPGGRYGSVIISTVTEKGEEVAPASAAVVSRIGTLFFVRIPGPILEEGRMTQFGTKIGQKFFGQGPIDFKILYENTGNVYLNPYGEIRIGNVLGKEVGMIKVDPWFAMPDSLRLREISWNQNRLFGVYTAHAFVNRGYEDIVDEASYTFFVIPWKLALILLLSVFVLILILRFILKRFEFRRKV